MLQIQHVASKITSTDRNSSCLCLLEFITLHFQDLNKLKMGTSLFHVTVTLQRQRKIVNIFFLKQDTFLTFLKCLTLLPKNAHGITQRPTL